MPSFIGRGEQLREIRAALAGARGGSGSALLIAGEPGIGKTRLVDEAAEEATRSGFTVLRGACPSEGSRPLQPLSDALGARLFDEEERVSFANVLILSANGETLASASPKDDPGLAGMLAAVQEFVADTFGHSGGMLGRMEYGNLKILAERAGDVTVVAVLRGTEHGGMRARVKDAAGRIASGSAASAQAEALASERFLVRRSLEGVRLETERNRISELALTALASKAKDAPVLLVIEDIHWADESSLFALGYLVRNAKPERIAILATARPGEKRADAIAKRLAAAGSLRILPLLPMDEESVRRLLASEMPANDFPPEFASKLAADCRGNPFFLTEMLRQMLSDGAIAETDGKFTLSSAGFSVPASIEEMAERRLSALDPEAASMAEFASCIGREFEVGTTASLATVSDAGGAMERLRAHGIIDVDGNRARFVHALFQDATYRSVTPRWKQTHHKSLGEHLERENAGDLDAVVYDLARHFSRTAEHGKACGYCAAAGEKAEASFAAEMAASFYELALAASAKSPGAGDRAMLLERLGDALVLAGAYDRALARYADALSSAADVPAKARLCRKRSAAREKKSDFAGAIDEVDAGIALVGEEELEHWRLLLQRANSVQRRGDFDDVIALVERALPGLARFEGTERERGRALSMLGFANVRKGRHERAIDCFTGAMAIMRDIGDEGGLSNNYNNLGILHYNRGELDIAEENYSRALEICVRRKDQAGIALLQNNMAVLHTSRGDLRGSLDLNRKSLAIREKLGDESGIAMSLVNLGETLGEMGDGEGALQNYRRNLAIVERLGDHRGEALACSNIAMELAKRGDYAGAEEWYLRNIDISRKWDVKDYLVEGLLGLAETCVEAGRPDDARRLCAEAEPAIAQAGFRVYDAYLLRVLARLHSSTGDAEKAEECFGKARDIYAELQAENEVAKILMYWGGHLAGLGRTGDGRDMLEAAHATFTRRGMMYWEKRCEAALAQTDATNR